MTSIGCSWWLHLPPLFLDTHQVPPGPPPSQPQTPPVWLPALETPPRSAATVSASQINFPGLPAGASAHRTGLKVGHCWVYSALTQDDADCVSPVCPRPPHADPESCEDGPSASVLAFWMWGRLPPRVLKPWTPTRSRCEFAAASCPARWHLLATLLALGLATWCVRANRTPPEGAQARLAEDSMW